MSKPIIGGTEIKCPTCEAVFLFAYGMAVKLSDFKCQACGTDLWDTAMQDAKEAK